MQRPSIYLDTSTIADVFAASRGSTKVHESYRRLHDVVVRAAQQNSICFSFVHVFELFRWSPFESVLDRARWMDSLQPTWIKAYRRAEEEELAWWLRNELGLPRDETFSPFATDLLGVLTLLPSPDHVAQLRSEPTVYAFMRHAYPRRGELPDLGEVSSQVFAELHRDRDNLPEGITERDVDRITTLKFNEDIRRRAGAMWPAIAMFDHRLTLNDVIEGANRCLDDGRSIPLCRMSHSAIHEIGRRITSQPDSNSSSFRRRYAGTAFDVQHLSGAAYCDVFTCDAATDRTIGDLRVRRGLARQLSVGETGGPDAFVAALETQIERTSANVGAG